jgi:hypothetical protein
METDPIYHTLNTPEHEAKIETVDPKTDVLIDLSEQGFSWRKFFLFIGPGFFISVGN